MNTNDPNLEKIERVAKALGPLANRILFVGGCVVGLLITDKGRSAVRNTMDVDLVVDADTGNDYYRWGEKLRARGFREQVGEIICRWTYEDLDVT